jgi:hypothetical protein
MGACRGLKVQVRHYMKDYERKEVHKRIFKPVRGTNKQKGEVRSSLFWNLTRRCLVINTGTLGRLTSPIYKCQAIPGTYRLS